MFETELETFFSHAFEEVLNEKLFFRDFKLDEKKLEQYTDTLVSIPIETYVKYMVSHMIPPAVTAQDIVQFSSLEDATTRICKRLAEEGDEGLRYDQIGRLLLNDGKERNIQALRKYGENHSKTALELGLLQERCEYYYLSCLGVVFNNYQTRKQQSLLCRLMLRNRFIQRLVILSQKGHVSVEKEMSFLAASTIKRRMPNIRTLFNLFDIEELQLFSNIVGLGMMLSPELPLSIAAQE